MNGYLSERRVTPGETLETVHRCCMAVVSSCREVLG